MLRKFKQLINWELRMPTIKINEVDYDTDNFSDEARAQFSMIQYADGRLADLQGQLAVLQTAKAAYVAKLAQIVEDNKKDQE